MTRMARTPSTKLWSRLGIQRATLRVHGLAIQSNFLEPLPQYEDSPRAPWVSIFDINASFVLGGAPVNQ